MALSLLIAVLISNATSLNSTADDIDKVIDLILDEVTKIEESELTDYNYTRLIFFILLLIIIILVKSRLYKALFNCCCRRKKLEMIPENLENTLNNENIIQEPVQLLSITKNSDDDDEEATVCYTAADTDKTTLPTTITDEKLIER
ncbi:hypothetical protein [Rachiplusia nu nucleopolyhedrovirus]|uniref:Uncharacterized protein n=1 Tax=Rachiplusia nu nucleopolyhedrovirus TaxID=2605775 RepID=A0AAF1DB42_9ABAC|nr:hypothetical protein QKQ55_gp122 [Rachiplusia nu nucleopolyhedrovirus]QEI03632.1 hypothetical protein [Rachiplusia nu nucleopolyhedrovirus]